MTSGRDEPAERLNVTKGQAFDPEPKRGAIATRFVSTLERMAAAFEDSATFADYEAERRAADGREDAEEERQVAARAREAAQRARSQADEWRRHLRKPV